MSASDMQDMCRGHWTVECSGRLWIALIHAAKLVSFGRVVERRINRTVSGEVTMI
jgi:hypothetical protein